MLTRFTITRVHATEAESPDGWPGRRRGRITPPEKNTWRSPARHITQLSLARWRPWLAGVVPQSHVAHGSATAPKSRPFRSPDNWLKAAAPSVGTSGWRPSLLVAPGQGRERKRGIDPASHRLLQPREEGGGGGARGEFSGVLPLSPAESARHFLRVCTLLFLFLFQAHWRSRTLPRGSSAPHPLHTPAPCCVASPLPTDARDPPSRPMPSVVARLTSRRVLRLAGDDVVHFLQARVVWCVVDKASLGLASSPARPSLTRCPSLLPHTGPAHQRRHPPATCRRPPPRSRPADARGEGGVRFLPAPAR